MIRHRSLEEDLWDDDEQGLSADHVVERFFPRRERHSEDSLRRHRSAAKGRRREPPVVREGDDAQTN